MLEDEVPGLHEHYTRTKLVPMPCGREVQVSLTVTPHKVYEGKGMGTSWVFRRMIVYSAPYATTRWLPDVHKPPEDWDTEMADALTRSLYSVFNSQMDFEQKKAKSKEINSARQIYGEEVLPASVPLVTKKTLDTKSGHYAACVQLKSGTLLPIGQMTLSPRKVWDAISDGLYHHERALGKEVVIGLLWRSLGKWMPAQFVPQLPPYSPFTPEEMIVEEKAVPEPPVRKPRKKTGKSDITQQETPTHTEKQPVKRRASKKKEAEDGTSATA